MRIVGLLRGWLSFFAFRIALHRIGVITADTHRFPEFGLTCLRVAPFSQGPVSLSSKYSSPGHLRQACFGTTIVLQCYGQPPTRW
jgi:hypothetical protein